MTKLNQKLKILSMLRIFFQPNYCLISLDILLCLIYFFLTCVKTKYEGGLVETVSKNKEIEKLKFAVVKVIVFYLVYHILDKVREKINTKLAHSSAIKLKELVFGNIVKPKDQELARSSPATVSDAINTMSKDLRECSPDLFIEPFYCIIRAIVLIFFMNGISPTLTKVALCITPAKVLLAFWKRKENTVLAKKYNEMTNSLAAKTEKFTKIFYQQDTSDIENNDSDDIITNEKKLNSIHKQHLEDPWAFGFRKGLLEKIVQVILVWYGGMLVIEGKLTVGQLTAFNVQFRAFIGLFTTFKKSSKELSAALTRFEKFFDIMTIDSKYQEESDKIFYAKLHECICLFKQFCLKFYVVIEHLTRDFVVVALTLAGVTRDIILLSLNCAIENKKIYIEKMHKIFYQRQINNDTDRNLKKAPIIETVNNKSCELSEDCLTNTSQQQCLIEEYGQNCKTELDSIDSILSEVATSANDTSGIATDNILKELDQENEKYKCLGSGSFLDNSSFEAEAT